MSNIKFINAIPQSKNCSSTEAMLSNKQIKTIKNITIQKSKSSHKRLINWQSILSHKIKNFIGINVKK